MKINKAIISLLSLAVIIAITGCKSNNTYDEREDIVLRTVDALDSKDVNKVADLYFEPGMEKEQLNQLNSSEIQRFLNDYTGSTKITIDNGSLIESKHNLKANGISYDSYSSVTAIVDTKDTSYNLTFTFYSPTRAKDRKNHPGGLSSLVIKTVQSDAYYNTCRDGQYMDLCKNESFKFLDNDDYIAEEYGKEHGATGYKLIMSNFLYFNDNTATLSQKDADDFVTLNETTSEEVIQRFGTPAAIDKSAGLHLYYKTNESNKYVCFSCTIYKNKPNTVYRCDTFGTWYPNCVDITNLKSRYIN